MAVPVGGAVFLNISNALSEETLDILCNASGSLSSMGLPNPDDILGWSRLQEFVERHALPESDQLVERLSPAIAGFSIAGVPVLDVRPRRWKQEKKVAIYMHDGLMLYTAASTLGRAALFADDTALRVISVDYTLAPLSTFDEITNQVVNVVRAISTQGYKWEDILMVGEGSGAGLVIAAILKIRNLALGLPAAAVLISPYIDLSSADDTDYPPQSLISSSFNEIFMEETKMSNDFGEGWKMHTAPIYADFFKGFSATLIQGSTQGPWFNHFFRLYHVLDVAGVQVRLDLYEDMPQGFQLRKPDVPQSQIARRKLREFARFRLYGDGRPELPNKYNTGKLEIFKSPKKRPHRIG
jgi:epsilon-lactone hydrolase